MFDELIRAAEGLNGMRISIEIPLDDQGYFDRACPSNVCGAHFKVLFEDWKTEKVSDNRVYCPICRAEYPADEWNTVAQQEHMKSVALNRVQQMLGAALQYDAELFNRRQPRGGFISMRLSYKPGSPVIVMPVKAAEELEQHYTCDNCQLRYATLGAGYFCPGCGQSTILQHFSEQLLTLRLRVESSAQLRASIEGILGKSQAEDTVRALMEGAIGEMVALFQHYSEALYKQLPSCGGVVLPKNTFQRLNQGSEYWERATGKSYASIVGDSEMPELNRFFQMRHLIEHRGGIVDAEYIRKTGDLIFSDGQRLVIRESEVLRFVDLVSRLGSGLKSVAKIIP